MFPFLVRFFARPSKIGGSRKAFLLGNSRYEDLDPLDNPKNDIQALERALKRLNYKVSAYTDLDKATTINLIDKFIRELDNSKDDDVLFYYSGHGVQYRDDNYIVPVDFYPEHGREGLVQVQFNILRLLTQKAKNRFLFLDACRDTGGLEAALRDVENFNPAVFSPSSSSSPTASSSRSLRADKAVTGGLARMKPDTDNTFIAFAADPGDVARDGKSGTSPFAKAVISNLEHRGLEVFDFSQRVARQVRKTTHNKKTGWAQIPWTSSNMSTAYFFNQPTRTPIYALAILGAIAGLSNWSLAFNSWGEGFLCLPQKVPEGTTSVAKLLCDGFLVDVSLHRERLLTSAVLAIFLGLAAWRWGTPRDWVRNWNIPRWGIGFLTALVFFAVAVLSRIWFEDLDPRGLYDKVKGVTPNTFVDPNDNSIPLRQLLLLIMLPTALSGMASVLSGGLFVKELHRLGYIACGTIIGASSAAMFIAFIILENAVQGDNPARAGIELKYFTFLLVVGWEAWIGLNVGYAYAKFRPTAED